MRKIERKGDRKLMTLWTDLGKEIRKHTNMTGSENGIGSRENGHVRVSGKVLGM